jgi:predicted phage terminase large subunit-like protein
LPIVLSIDPGQKGGPTNSFSVIQVWAPKDGTHLLLDQWREQTTYREFRSEAQRFIRTYRPSVVLIEDTGHGPALISDIRPQRGMELVAIIPAGDKVERLQKHRRVIRRGLVRLPGKPLWYNDFINEVTEFPCGPFDDQVDALSQYLNWISEHPNPHKRTPMATGQGVDSEGRTIPLAANGPGIQAKGVVLHPRGRTTFNGPFQQPRVTVEY